MSEWPDWCQWELELSAHLLKRMIDRGFSEVDLRTMMDAATGHHEDDYPGRWVVETEHEAVPWEVIVEPDWAETLWW
jgi:hypothetical protein